MSKEGEGPKTHIDLDLGAAVKLASGLETANILRTRTQALMERRHLGKLKF